MIAWQNRTRGPESSNKTVNVEDEEERPDKKARVDLARVDVAEIYSPVRVTEECNKFGLKPGEAMDLMTGWDFRRPEDKDRALRYIREEKPKLVIGSPMCKMFSQLQHLSPWNDKKQERWVEDRRHIEFVCQIYRMQMQSGNWFLHEHPAGASSWGLREVKQIMYETNPVRNKSGNKSCMKQILFGTNLG